MPKRFKKHYTTPSLKTALKRLAGNVRHPMNWWQSKRLFTKIWSALAMLILAGVLVMFLVGQWYILSQRNKSPQYGVTFIPNYARYLGLNPKTTMQAMLDDLGVRHFRLVSYWKEIEPAPGKYDFKELDWQFKKAREGKATISLSIGLRQPRWPECHTPKWAANMPKNEWYPKLKDFLRVVINRYKDEPNLVSYQLENEYFLEVFGKCPDFSRDRLIEEYNLVKSLDSSHPIIISRSNNWFGLPVGQPRPDEFGISVYKRVWDRTVTNRYVEYPYPAWYYAFYAGAAKIITGKDSMLHELQAEPWMPEGVDLRTSSTEEQYKSMNPARLKGVFELGRATGMKQIDLWGAEWWYWRKVHFNDPSLWNVAREEFAKN